MDPRALGAQCDVCPLNDLKNGPVPSEIRQSGLIVIGEAPGEREVERGESFIGPSGRFLNDALRRAGTSRSVVSVTNAVLCRPVYPDGRAAESFEEYETRGRRMLGSKWRSPVECCRPRLVEEIRRSKAGTILGLGKRALESVGAIYDIPVGGKGRKVRGELRLANILEQRGHPFELEGPSDLPRMFMPTLHPAHSLRSAKHMQHVIADDIAMGVRIAARGHRSDYRDPPYILDPSATEILDWVNNAIRNGAPIMVDIETDSLDTREANIRCVGAGYWRKNGQPDIIVIPFRTKAGRPWWNSHKEHALAWQALQLLLKKAALEFQNGAYDTRVLLNRGAMTDRDLTWFDTILAAHDSRENDCPKDLGSLASRHGEFPLWKIYEDHKVHGNEEEDADLHLYCARDIYAQLVVSRGLKRWIVEDGTEPQFEVDRRLQPKIRDMSERGAVIDTRTKEEYSEIVHGRLAKLSDKLQSIVGPNYNPRSPKQTADWLFRKKGYTPKVNTKQKEYEDGDSASTSTKALTALIDAGVDKETEVFCEVRIQYSALEKIRSSYLDNLTLYDDPTLPSHLKRLWTNYNQHVVPSGRLSSSKPINFQNIPKQGIVNLRKMFVAPPGHVLVCADFEQLEARLFAIVVQDETYLRAFKDGLDVHTLNAIDMNGGVLDYKDLMRRKAAKDPKFIALRNQAKAFGFSKQYGAQYKSIFENMNAKRDPLDQSRLFPKIKLSMVRKFDENWTKAHPAHADYASRVRRQVREFGYVEEPWHKRRRYFPGGPSKQEAPGNHIIQGFAAAIANDSLEKICDAIPYRGWSTESGVFLQVHDEIGAIVPEDRAAEAVEIFNDAMDYTIDGVRVWGDAEASYVWTGDKLQV